MRLCFANTILYIIGTYLILTSTNARWILFYIWGSGSAWYALWRNCNYIIAIITHKTTPKLVWSIIIQLYIGTYIQYIIILDMHRPYTLVMNNDYLEIQILKYVNWDFYCILYYDMNVLRCTTKRYFSKFLYNMF